MSGDRLEHPAQAAPDNGVVVDDQDADRGLAHGRGTSATIVVPAPWLDSIFSLPPRSVEPLAHPEEAQAFAGAGQVEATSVVLDHGRDDVGLSGQDDADRARLGVLDDVRQRLLDDSVERCFDMGRKAVADLRLEFDAHSGLRGEGVAQSLESRHEPEVVERLRPQLHRDAAHIVQRPNDLLAHAGQRLGAFGVALRLLDGLQSKEHRSQLLPGLVVELPSQAAPFELLRLHYSAKRVGRDPSRQVDGCRGAGSEGLCEAEVFIGEARVVAFLVVGDDDSDRPPSRNERYVEAGADVQRLRRLLVDLGIVGEGVDLFGAPALEHAATLRACPLELEAQDVVGADAVSSFDSQRTARPGKRDRHHSRADQAAQAPADEFQQARQLDLPGQRGPDLVQALRAAPTS